MTKLLSNVKKYIYFHSKSAALQSIKLQIFNETLIEVLEALSLFIIFTIPFLSQYLILSTTKSKTDTKTLSIKEVTISRIIISYCLFLIPVIGVNFGMPNGKLETRIKNIAICSIGGGVWGIIHRLLLNIDF